MYVKLIRILSGISQFLKYNSDIIKMRGIYVKITEQSNFMFNSGELIGTTEYLTL
jgi:hypothetical protein